MKLKNKFVQRAKNASTASGRVTIGKVYEVIDGKIKDDHGNPFKPYMNSDYWIDVSDLIDENLIQNGDKEMTKEKDLSGNFLQIEDVVLIDGNRADTMDDGLLLQHIESEKKHLDYIDSLGIKKSQAIAKICDRHNKNIEKLLAILDSRYEDVPAVYEDKYPEVNPYSQ